MSYAEHPELFNTDFEAMGVGTVNIGGQDIKLVNDDYSINE
jgi:hypothetical protein